MHLSGKTCCTTGYIAVPMPKVHISRPADSAINQITSRMQQDSRCTDRQSISALWMIHAPFIYPPAHRPTEKLQCANYFRHTRVGEMRNAAQGGHPRFLHRLQVCRTHDRRDPNRPSCTASTPFMHQLASQRSRFAPLLSRVSHAPWR